MSKKSGVDGELSGPNISGGSALWQRSNFASNCLLRPSKNVSTIGPSLMEQQYTKLYISILDADLFPGPHSAQNNKMDDLE